MAQVWRVDPRNSVGALNPPPLQQKPNLKTLEDELHYQVEHCYRRLQQDLDLLHEQVFREVHSALTEELRVVAQRVTEVQNEDRAQLEPVRKSVVQLCEDAEYFRKSAERNAQAAEEAAILAKTEAVEASRKEVGALKAEMAKQQAATGAMLMELQRELAVRLHAAGQELDGRVTAAEAAAQQKMESHLEAFAKMSEELPAKLLEASERQHNELASRTSALEESATQLQARVFEVQEGLQAESLVGEARFRESQAAVAGLEQRQAEELQAALMSVAVRADALDRAGQVSAAELQDQLNGLEALAERAIAEVQHLATECKDGLALAQCSMARSIEWAAEVDVERLLQTGHFEAASPRFSAAGLNQLQLSLRVAQAGGREGETPHTRSKKWAIGVFLRGQGQVTFRLHVAGKNQSFKADFAESKEWGSHKLAVLEHFGDVLPVQLEILEVVAASASDFWPPSISATMRLADAEKVAAREVALFRSSMVRRVEWRVSRISERLAAARSAANSKGDDEALEPIVSPPFAAAGLEGLQLQLYPLGYRPRGEESCGFFLTCPRGVYVKCKAFVGDAIRNFEHQYDDREPYGRGSFCRLSDKVESDDSVLCGIEFVEVRLEQTLQVRHGPFGSLQDQLKVVSNAAIGGVLESIRELKEPGISKEALARQKSRSRAAPYGVAVSERGAASDRGSASPRHPVPGSLAGVKSLPLLLPSVVASHASPPYPLDIPQRGADLMPWR